VSGRARDHSDAANVLTIKPFDNTDDDNSKEKPAAGQFFSQPVRPRPHA